MDILLITTPWPAQSLPHSFRGSGLFIPDAIFGQKIRRVLVSDFPVSTTPIGATTMESHLLGCLRPSALWI